VPGPKLGVKEANWPAACMAHNRSPSINDTILGIDINDTDTGSPFFPDLLLEKADFEAEGVVIMLAVFLCGLVMAFSYVVWQCVNGLSDAVVECLLCCGDWWNWCTGKTETPDQIENDDDDTGQELTRAKDEDAVCE
jgi:hypothetical protein